MAGTSNPPRQSTKRPGIVPRWHRSKTRQTDAVVLSQRRSSAEAGLIPHASVMGSVLGVPAGLIGAVVAGALGAAAGALLPEGLSTKEIRERFSLTRPTPSTYGSWRLLKESPAEVGLSPGPFISDVPSQPARGLSPPVGAGAERTC
jgi:hypothetical protein